MANIVEGAPPTVAGAAAALRTRCERTAFPFDPLREPPSVILPTVINHVNFANEANDEIFIAVVRSPHSRRLLGAMRLHGFCCAAYFGLWHKATDRCGANVLSLLGVKRTLRGRREHVDL